MGKLKEELFMNMKQPYEEPRAEVLYLKIKQDLLSISNPDFDEEDDDMFN